MSALLDHLAAARDAWPTLAYDETAYATWLAAHDAETLARLPTLEPRDVVLAWAAAGGSRDAHVLLETHYLSSIGNALRRFSPDRAFVDEVTQRVRVKLLVPRDGTLAPIAEYALGGSLTGLVKVAAIREALNQRRGQQRDAPVEELEAVAGVVDPELAQLKARYAQAFERAFTAAVADLSGKERYLLRLNMSAKASIDDIARIFDTHRATAARWLNAARDRLADRTREHLRTSLGIAEDELVSLLRLIRTEATRLLDSIAPGPDEE